MMYLLLLTLGILSSVNGNSSWKIEFTENSNNSEIFMNEFLTVPFVVVSPSNDFSNINLSIVSSDTEVATLEPKWDPTFSNTSYFSFKIYGISLGKVTVKADLYNNGEKVTSEDLIFVVRRQQRLIDTVFTASVAILVSILYINFGCAMDWEVCQKTIKRPIGPLIGCFCQFVLMPLISYFLAIILFPDSPNMQLGLFFTGISPSGGASNIWTVLLGGNLNLSVTMTTISTIAAFGLMPLWIFTLGRHIFEKGNLAMPYSKIATFAVALIVPLSIGYLIQKKLPKFSKVMVKVLKPFSAILIAFIVIFAIVTNLYLLKLFSWKIILAGMGLPWLGFLFGLIVALILQQPNKDVRAIAIETGIQNTGIAIFLLRFSLGQPAADITTVVPVSCAIMTPLPLTILYFIKLVLDRRKKKSLVITTDKLAGVRSTMINEAENNPTV